MQKATTRRDLLKLIGTAGGFSMMYQSMAALGATEPSRRDVPLRLEGSGQGSSVLVLGAGLAGLTAAYELTRAGYKVEILEYDSRVGGRCWTVRGGDTFTELGGATQTCKFDPGQYLNPGPMRIPHDHRAILHYCRRFGVPLEPFMQVNSNAYVHSSTAFGGRPQRYGDIQADYEGYVAELLAKTARQHILDDVLTQEDLEILLGSLQDWGALDATFRYRMGDASARRRGYKVRPGGGLSPQPTLSEPVRLSDLLRSDLWRSISSDHYYHFQPAIFQPVGGMDRIAAAFGKQVGHLVKYGAKVEDIRQSDDGVTVTYRDQSSGVVRQARANWCICTIPASVLGQISMNVSTSMSEAIAAMHYASSVKVGLQFKRRFWEQDEEIYGGITSTDLSINQIVYPSCGYATGGKGVLVAGFVVSLPRFKPARSYEVTGMSPEERVDWALREGRKIHPQYDAEFDNGFSVAWHRVPTTLGCFGRWKNDDFDRHFQNLCQLDGRIVLAGEHASRLPGWQEGAIQSALDALERIHSRALSSGA